MAVRPIPMRGREFFDKVAVNGEKNFRRIQLEPNFDLVSVAKKEGYEGFQKSLMMLGAEAVDFSYSSLEGLIAPGLFLVGARCYETNFKRAKLECANFSCANLRKADLEEAVVLGGMFKNARMHEANFSRADLRCSEFNGSRSIGAIFRGARLNSSAFTGAKLKNVNFDNCEDGTITNLDGVYMNGVMLSNVSFEGARLTYANFSGADFCNVNITGACLYGASIGRNEGFKNCKGLSSETFRLHSSENI